MRRMAFALALGIGLQLGAGTAWAWSPGLTATAQCAADGTSVISYTSTSWDTSTPDGSNSDVDVYLNGVKIHDGAYVLPGNSFSGSVAAPSGTSAAMAAIANGEWGSSGIQGGQTEHITVPLPGPCPGATGDGRFTGGGSQIRIDGVRVTRGLTVHCDLLLSNNLQINWAGNQFHMEEHMQTVSCTDDPQITQAPPAAPLDTMVGVGAGRYNGAAGYTVQFTFVDYGEPGNQDRASLRVFETANPANVVLNVPLQVLSGGNLQAHYDQPHK